MIRLVRTTQGIPQVLRYTLRYAARGAKRNSSCDGHRQLQAAYPDHAVSSK